MSKQIYSRHPQQSKTMTEEQFEEIVAAILAGKYSWACVLILQTAGYNPLHYIPYRTYNRLIKENRLGSSPKTSKESVANGITRKKTQTSAQNSKPNPHIQDLTYIENAEENTTNVKGGIGHSRSVGDVFCLSDSLSSYCL